MNSFDPFAVPNDVAGYLEWFSGTLFVNETLDGLHARLRRPSPNRDDLLFWETITHETYHFYQIATTGFPFQMACLMFAELTKLIRPPISGDRLLELTHSPPAPSPQLSFLAEFLDEEGPGHVSTRDLIESSAFLYGRRIHCPGLRFSGYETWLRREQPPREYRRAYETARDVIGPDVFGLFLPICFAALCFGEPNLAFLDVVHAARDLPVQPRRNIELVQNLCSSAGKKHALLGTAFQVAFDGTSPFGELHHPVYSDAAAALLNGSETINPIDLMCSPNAFDSIAAKSLIRPILLRGGVLRISADLAHSSEVDAKVRANLEAVVRLGLIGLSVSSSCRMFSRFRRSA